MHAFDVKSVLIMSDIWVSLNIPVGVVGIILEFKGGIELWEKIQEDYARPDASYDVQVFESPHWDICDRIRDDEEIFQEWIFHSLSCNFILWAEMCNEFIEIEPDEEVDNSGWMSNMRPVDERILECCIKASLDGISSQIKKHTCSSMGFSVPTLEDWLEDKEEFDGGDYEAYEELPETSIFKVVFKRVINCCSDL